MSNFQYKNPLSPIQVLGAQSVSRTSTFGTNFSILGTGGYMEVYGLTDLNFVIPVGQTGFIEFSGNTIPIEFNKGTGTAFSPDVVTLNSDNMSSGRRRLGMLVYVYETNKIYRHTIENYGGLWSAATDASGVGGPTVVVSDFGTTVKNNSVAGQNLINAWTGSTIEGVDGYTNLNATWRELVTGSGGTSTADTFVTGFTLSSNTITLTQNRTDQYSSFTISLSAYTGSSSTSGAFLPLSGGTVTGNTIFQSGLTANTLTVTGNTLLSGLTAATISATTYLNYPDTFVTGFTLSSNTITLSQNRTDQYSAFTISLSAYTGTSISGLYLPLSGGTVTGNTIFNSGLTANTLNVTGNTLLSGLTASTISATTYYNVSSNFQYEIHVSQVDGNDTTGDGSLLNPVASITQALTLLTGSRKTIIVHPGGYNESPTVTSGNTTIATSELTGANTVLYGTLTIGTLGSGTRISGLKMSNLVISGTAQAYISNCTVDTQVTKSSSGYVEIINTEMQCTLGIQISGAGITIINGNKNVAVSVSNASAQVIIKGCNSVVTPSASAGNLAIVDCIVTALGGNAITITNSATTLTLANSQVLVQAGNNVAPISVAGIYSIINTIYDKPGSSLTGSGTNSIDYFQYINADKFITQGGTSLQYVMGDGSLSNGFTGGTVSGATNFTNGLTATTISATTYQNVNAVTGGTYSNGTITLSGTGNFASSISGFPTTFINDYLPLSGGTVTGNTIFNSGLTANTLNVTGNTLLSGLTANTISATTYYNLPTDIRVTGGTYTNGTATFRNNTGGTFDVSGFAIGGGGGQIFYLNLSQSQNGNRLLSTTASTSSEQTSGVTIGNGVTGSIASFQTTPLNISLIPGGIWSFYLHSYKQNSNASFNIFVEVYKITSGGSQTLLFTTDPTSVTTNSPNPSMQLTDGYFSGTALNVSDGVVAVVKATNTGNQSHSITLVTEGSAHYSYVVSTIPTQQGLTCDTLSGCSIIQTIQTDVSNKLDKSGGTVNGNTVFQSGLTATTISATTYQNVNAVTGGSYSNGTITLSGTGNFASSISGFPTTFINDYLPLSGGTVTGGTIFQSGVTANTISATTYFNLPVSNFTGGTVSGATSFTNGLSANTISATTYENVNAVTGGTYNGTTGVITLSGTGSVNGNQITGFSTGGGGLTWNNATTAESASVDNGYVGTATTLTTITLPSTAAFGSIVEVVGTGTGLWRISQNVNQFINFGVATTTTGTGGYLSATSQYDCVKLLCTSADTAFVVTSAIGNIFYI